MKRLGLSNHPAVPAITICVSGKLFEGHLSYLDWLVQSASECGLQPRLNLAGLEQLDRAAVYFLINGENSDFLLTFCPNFVREWMGHEREHAAA